jgi:hypothetical protein
MDIAQNNMVYVVALNMSFITSSKSAPSEPVNSIPDDGLFVSDDGLFVLSDISIYIF